MAVDATIQTRLKDFMLSVSLQVGDELLALTGRNGSGKSVILRSIAGVYVPDAGAVTIRDRTVFSSGLNIDISPSDRYVGYVPPANALFSHLTVADNVAFPLRKHAYQSDRMAFVAPSDAEIERRIGELLDLLELAHLGRLLPEELAEPDRQRVALARALIVDPDVLLMDDPYAALDTHTRRQVRQDLVYFRKRVDIPIVFATSELDEAYEIADRIALIDRGQIVQVAAPRTLLMRPANRRAAELVRAVNVIPGTTLSANNGRIEVETALGILHVSEMSSVDGDVDVVVRPEHVRILGEDDSDTGDVAENLLFGAITEESTHEGIHTLTFTPDGTPEEIALQILVTDLSYRQLGLSRDKRRVVLLPPRALHLMPRVDRVLFEDR